MAAYRRDDDLLRLLAEMPRHEAPPIPLERIVVASGRRRTRAAGLVVAAIALPLAVAFLLLLRGGEAPSEDPRLPAARVGDPVAEPPEDPAELGQP